MCVTQACTQNWINLDKILRGNLMCSYYVFLACESFSAFIKTSLHPIARCRETITINCIPWKLLVSANQGQGADNATRLATGNPPPTSAMVPLAMHQFPGRRAALPRCAALGWDWLGWAGPGQCANLSHAPPLRLHCRCFLAVPLILLHRYHRDTQQTDRPET